jgi:hypothetical protein
MIRTAGPFHVKVGWAPDQDVQLGIEGDDGRSLFWLLFGQDPAVRDELGRRVAESMRGPAPDLDLGVLILNHLDTLDSPTGRGYQGIWTDLDRPGINRLIRLLRKARDSAYGADA